MLVFNPSYDLINNKWTVKYTKHYYAGSQRVASRIGNSPEVGNFLKNWTLQTQIGGEIPINQEKEAQRIYKKSYESKLSVYENWKIPSSNRNGGFSDYGTEVSNSISVGSSETLNKFFYHSDHLGSTSYITDSQGNVTQHHETEERGSPTPKQIKKRRQYIPFGETFVSEYKNAGYNSPYRFNSKEFDENTGFYYYGARYYNPKTSLWISVDPLADFNPFMNSEHYIDGQHNGGVFNNKNTNVYGYCYQNPVRLIDPNGKQTESPFIVGEAKSPGFQYDNGYSKFPKQTPTWNDRIEYEKWSIKGLAATNYPPLHDAGLVYLNYMRGTGKSQQVNLGKYLTKDNSEKKMFENGINIAKEAAMKLLISKATITSKGFEVGGRDSRFPYPETENWQKTLGAFNFWMSASVSIDTQKDGSLKYKMNLTFHAEDLYNFNPGAEDIKTGIADSVNGRFEVVDYAKQYMNYGTYTTTQTWTIAPDKANKIEQVKEQR